ANELYETLGLGALKYFLLKVDPKKRMLFNPEESIQFQGFTGPFIQYTHARISAILRKAAEMGLRYDNPAEFESLPALLESERELIHIISEFRDKVREAGEAFDPSKLAQYIYELAKEYNRFYTDAPIFG